MTPDLPEKIIHKIETICEQGCTHVNQLLDNANSGNAIDELSGYDQAEVKQVISELKKIMSVYDDKDC